MVGTCNDYLYFAYAKGKLQWLHFYYKSLLLINIRSLSDYCYWYYLNPLFQNHESNKSLSQIILSLFRVIVQGLVPCEFLAQCTWRDKFACSNGISRFENSGAPYYY